jgi:hypothetical protein
MHVLPEGIASSPSGSITEWALIDWLSQIKFTLPIHPHTANIAICDYNKVTTKKEKIG